MWSLTFILFASGFYPVVQLPYRIWLSVSRIFLAVAPCYVMLCLCVSPLDRRTGTDGFWFARNGCTGSAYASATCDNVFV
jgi:hypothetical protein